MAWRSSASTIRIRVKQVAISRKDGAIEIAVSTSTIFNVSDSLSGPVAPSIDTERVGPPLESAD